MDKQSASCKTYASCETAEKKFDFMMKSIGTMMDEKLKGMESRILQAIANPNRIPLESASNVGSSLPPKSNEGNLFETFGKDGSFWQIGNPVANSIPDQCQMETSSAEAMISPTVESIHIGVCHQLDQPPLEGNPPSVKGNHPPKELWKPLAMAQTSSILKTPASLVDI